MDGKQYGAYYKAANKSLIWYNAKVFENAGAAEPKTWKDLLSTAQKVYDSGVTPFSVGGADGWTLTDWFENVYLSQAGPEKYDQLAQHKIKWTDPSVKQALTTLAQVWSKKDYIAGGPSGALQTEFPASVTQTFTGGDQPKAGMVFEGDFAQSTSVRPRPRWARTRRCSRSRPWLDRARGLRRRRGGDPEGLQGGAGAGHLPRLLGRGDDPGQARRLSLAEQERAELGVSERGAAQDRAGADRVGRPLPLRHVRPGPAGLRRHPRQGEWKDLQDFLKNPSDVAGTQAKLEKDAAAAYGSGS